MGRLVDPISDEDYEKLTPFNKWMIDHPYVTMFLMLILVGMAAHLIHDLINGLL